ncbi:hypothetical protein [uncultured Tolumonas sp.]|uniref:hypothetical protein n=1 Tax=uncultured Tolumonas sp. TaxID=263765 RepID=UPI00292F4E0A|nr:hypothetical protein [uncultured Tolumonas sp.]
MAAVFVLGILLLIGVLRGFFSYIYPYVCIALGLSALWVIGATFDRLLKSKHYYATVPIVVSALTLAWFFNGYLEYKSLCTSISETRATNVPQRTQDGFLYDFSSIGHFYEYQWSNDTSPNLMLMNRIFAYYELPPMECSICTNMPYRRVLNSDSIRTSTTINVPRFESKYIFRSSPVQRITSWWKVPTFKVNYSLSEIASGSLVIKKSEYLFGGEGISRILTSVFLAHGNSYGNPDYRFLGCGYASVNPDAWRPQGSAEPNMQRYFEADRQMLKALRR